MKEFIATIAISLLIGLTSGFFIGASKPVEQTMVVDYREEALSDWQLLQLAIIKTESDYSTTKVGTSGDSGVLQITSIYVDEANRLAGEDRWCHNDAFDPVEALSMFNMVQDSRNPSHDIYKAIKLHNPKGDVIGYEAKVLRNIEYIRRYESLRNLIRP